MDNKEAMVEGKIVRSRDNAEMQGDEAKPQMADPGSIPRAIIRIT